MGSVRGLFDYFSKVKLEFSKVSWLPKKDLLHLVIMVLVITVFTACCFTIIDAIASALVMKIIFI